MDERLVETLRGLARRDEELAARVADLRALESGVEAVRDGASAAAAFIGAYHGRRAQRAAAAAEARADGERRREELALAEHELAATSGDDAARAQAERAVERARDHVAVAGARLDRVEAAVAGLEREAQAVPAELAQLAARGGQVAEALDGETPGSEPAQLLEWAAQARATLFTSTAHLDAQRERVIREANELATMLLGEPTYGSTVAQVRARVEGTMRPSPS